MYQEWPFPAEPLLYSSNQVLTIICLYPWHPHASRQRHPINTGVGQGGQGGGGGSGTSSSRDALMHVLNLASYTCVPHYGWVFWLWLCMGVYNTCILLILQLAGLTMLLIPHFSQAYKHSAVYGSPSQFPTRHNRQANALG